MPLIMKTLVRPHRLALPALAVADARVALAFFTPQGPAADS